MLISSAATGKSISTPYKLLPKQTTKETTAYFVLEHTPRKCTALSAAGEMSFENICAVLYTNSRFFSRK